ncbi:MAG TPA: CotH kinase family protein, partial [Verrucomicrobiae bacterium]|nr:CotH kinase family protein [Verrucomicrobiae bacterium]
PVNSTSSPVATVRLTKTTVLRTAAYKQDYVPTDIDTHSYIFPASVAAQVRPSGASTTWIDDPPGNGQAYPADFTIDPVVVNNTLAGYSFTNALLGIPTLSVVTPLDGLFGAENGIYTHAFKEGTNWERRASTELIYPDGHEGFHVDAGLRMHGAVSRLNAALPKHPFRLIFRGEYGAAELDYPLFEGSPVRRFDHLILRACSTDAWPIDDILDFLWRSRDATYQRDQWMRDSQLAMGHLSAHGIYVHLYLNGLYWGLYNLTERMNDSFFAAHLGGERVDYDVVTDFDGQAVSGTRDMWTQLLQLADRAPSDANVLWQIQGLNPDGTRNPALPVLIHLDNFIDYIILHIYAAAIDWPGRNWWAARRRGPESDGFRFFVWDQEIALDRLDRVGTWGNAPANIEAVYEPNTPGQIYNGLRRDPEFRLRFADRLQKHLFSAGALTLQSNVTRWATRAAEIDHAIVGESARWGDGRHPPSYTRQNDWLRMSNFTQNIYWPANLTRAWTRFKNVGLYPDVFPPSLNQFGGDVTNGFLLTMTHSNTAGSIFLTIDGTDPRLRGGGVAPTARLYAQPFSLVSPTLVRARVRNGTTWSAIVEAQFYPPQDFHALELSEIMYNPPRFGQVDGDEVEFLELYNKGIAPLDLTGVHFTDGIEFAFPNRAVIGPKSFIVLARNATQFSAKFPGAPLHGIYSGRLDNSGEHLQVSDAFGETILSITYDDAAPWPAEADNSDLSLQRMNFGLSGANPMSWIAAPPTPGGPLPLELSDSDGDGMSDKWELDHGLIPGILDGDDDADSDGMTNYQEYLAGTNPYDPSDHLRLMASSVETSASRSILLSFSMRSNKTYTVVYADTIPATAWRNLVHWGPRPTNALVSFVDSLSSNAPSRFYRLATPRQP